MFSWFGSAQAKAERIEAPAKVVGGVNEQLTVVRDPLAEELPAVPLIDRFRDLLFGLGETPMKQSQQTEAEAVVLRHIDQILLSPSSATDTVPRLPAVLPRLMKCLRDENTSARDIADEIRRDTTLVAEVVRLANSPYYRTRQRISSLERATFILGRNGLRQLVANVAFKPVFSYHTGRFSRHARPLIWDQAERCAATTQCLAKQFDVDEFDAYLAGLVDNIGVTVVMRLMDDHYAVGTADPAAQFCNDLLDRARRLSSIIVHGWDFPTNIVSAIEAQTVDGDFASVSSLGQVLWTGNQLSMIHILGRRGLIDPTESFLSHCIPSNFLESAEDCFAKLEGFDQPDSR
jgi:HD-like signal output (HDOD) protein